MRGGGGLSYTWDWSIVSTRRCSPSATWMTSSIKPAPILVSSSETLCKRVSYASAMPSFIGKRGRGRGTYWSAVSCGSCFHSTLGEPLRSFLWDQRA